MILEVFSVWIRNRGILMFFGWSIADTYEYRNTKKEN